MREHRRARVPTIGSDHLGDLTLQELPLVRARIPRVNANPATESLQTPATGVATANEMRMTTGCCFVFLGAGRLFSQAQSGRWTERDDGGRRAAEVARNGMEHLLQAGTEAVGGQLVMGQSVLLISMPNAAERRTRRRSRRAVRDECSCHEAGECAGRSPIQAHPLARGKKRRRASAYSHPASQATFVVMTAVRKLAVIRVPQARGRLSLQSGQ